MPLKLSHLAAGFIAVLVGYTSSVAIIFQAISASGASEAQAASWMMALGLGMGLTTLVLSLRHRMPILTAWSTPGAALLAIALQGTEMSDAIGAFLLCGLLLTFTGLTGWFEKLTRALPAALANALLAGVLFQFGLSGITALQTDTTLVGIMGLAFVAAKLWAPRYAIVLSLAAGIVTALSLGAIPAPAPGWAQFSWPVFTLPTLSLHAAIGVALPLYVVTMCSQNMPGVVTLRAAGYTPPVSEALTVTGLATLLLAPFGGYAFNLAAITAAICAGPEADDDPKTRYISSVVAGLFYCIVGACGAAVIALFAIAPAALVAAIAALALLSTIANSLEAALADPKERIAALVTFMIALSGISFFGIGAAFWALVIGLPLYHLLLRAKG